MAQTISAPRALLRISVQSEGRRLDIGVPAHVPLIEFMPGFARSLGVLDPTMTYAGYALQKADGTVLYQRRGSKAGEAWRTRVIYQTNLMTSYAAGRRAQLLDPDLVERRPFWRYVHNDSVTHPRPQHKRWGDMKLTLRHDHPFWETHFPPNGWGCKCRVVAVAAPVT